MLPAQSLQERPGSAAATTTRRRPRPRESSSPVSASLELQFRQSQWLGPQAPSRRQFMNRWWVADPQTGQGR
jgi:hypothetical protein